MVLGENGRLLSILSEGSRDRISVFLILFRFNRLVRRNVSLRKGAATKRDEEKAGAARGRGKTGRRFRIESSYKTPGARV